ncbi:F-box domain protein [Aspergillus taichungensis]|uniref:F-box domain protein n=1 Tax=Aspergillus taichungensis TaxID=482145 RepID=A0A2J5I0L2_9EURO|nr:F-box domain protein [Aspergillus taichungensis]
MLEMTTTNLDSVPYDIFYQIASTLDCQDLIHLSRVNHALHDLLRNESIARKIIEDLRYTKEGQRAIRSSKGYRNAVGRLFDVKESFATAQPYSASILGYGSAFLYGGGSLCYIFEDEIRSLDVHGASRVEQVLNIYTVLSRALPGCDPAKNAVSISLLHYSHGILSFMAEVVDREEAWLLAVDMRPRKQCARSGRLRLRTQLQSTRRLFVRNNRSYLYYGTHSALGYHGYPQWSVNCVNLDTGPDPTQHTVVLHNFAGTEIGQTVCFDVHEDHLYAVSTLIDFEEEEVDWTSLYMWICLAPDGRGGSSVRPNSTWRRQHREGPINDSWSDLTLRHDEATNRLTILECRREWLDGGSANTRTYYAQPLPSPAEILQGKQPRSYSPAHSTPAPLPDEPLARTISSSNKPTYEPPRKRLRRNYHQEYPVECDDDPSGRRDFILAKTKFRTYNHSASSFVDLVNDPRPPRAGSLVPRDRLRLRVVSRKRKSPIDADGQEGEPGLLFRPEMVDPDGRSVDDSEERFVSRGTSLWPPDHAPPELDQLLCPGRRTGRVHAMADERSLVYSVDQDGLTPGDQAIVLLNFDPSLRLPGLRRLDLEGALVSDGRSVAVELERPKVGDLSEAPMTHPCPPVNRRRANQAMPSVREEPAMYLRVGRGYWLR